MSAPDVKAANGLPEGLPPLRAVIAEHGLSAAKSLGQHFLLDPQLTDKIARAAGRLDDHDVLEIGPGPGGLTRSLLKAGARRLVAVEKDRRAVAALADLAARAERLTVIEGDALAFDMAASLDGPIKVVANLPYNVGTQILLNWLTAPDWPPAWSSLTLMFQREVAQRICAGVGDAHYGRLAVLANWRCHTDILFDVPAAAFTPPPKVVSSVVHLTPRTTPLPCSLKALETVTAAAFGQRRKMVRASLKSLGDAPALLEAAGIAPDLRAERVDIVGFAALANAYEAQT
ncbi:MAG: 16S rRNA (adenine(1518)-N(6)/adenine(1519)-N(6))-dimethyltransferase RsmA [Pseudomonadota bacterium]